MINLDSTVTPGGNQKQSSSTFLKVTNYVVHIKTLEFLKTIFQKSRNHLNNYQNEST